MVALPDLSRMTQHLSLIGVYLGWIGPMLSLVVKV